MRDTATVLDVRLISGAALAQYMAFREETNRSLAEKVGCSHGTIHNIKTGKVRTVPMKRAKAIARILNAPFESLFLAELSNVTRDVPPPARRSA